MSRGAARRRAAIAGWALCAVVASCAGTAAAKAERSGGTMGETTVTWLEGGPALTASEEASDQLDPRPVVLWAGARPAAVLGYRVESALFGTKVSRSFRRVDGGPRGPFPLETTTLQTPGSPPKEDGPHPGFLVTADVDGDGTDELVLPTWRGGAEVVGVRARHPGFAGPRVNGSVARYVPVGTQVARVGASAVVHVLFQREKVERGATDEQLGKAGAADPYLLVRVDRSGARRVVLGAAGFEPDAVLAVGAVNRPGSPEVDELVVLSRKDRSQDVYVSRHRPDGATLALARQVYVPIASAAPWAFAFVAQSQLTVLWAPGTPEVHFVEAEKPVNWIHRVDLKAASGGSSDISLVGVADAQGTPKALVNVGAKVFAVDAEGRFHVATGGALAPVEGEEPLYRIQSPGPGLEAEDLVASAAHDDTWLVVHTRAAQPRELTHEEIAEAADRFLLPKEVAEERRDAVPTLEGRSAVRDGFIEEERKQKRIDTPISTTEEWRRLLPESYARTEEYRRQTLDSHLRSSLIHGLRHPDQLTAEHYKNPAGAGAWLAGLVLPAETTFTLCRRGAVVRTIRVDRQLVPAEFGDVAVPVVAWRDGPSGTTVVVALLEPSARKPSFKYAVVTAAPVR